MRNGGYMDKPLWGLRVLKFDGAIAPRVLKFDSGFAAEGCGGRLLIDGRRPLMKKPLQPHLLKRVPPTCKGERTMRWRGRPPIGGQDSDRVSHRCSAPYTLLPLRGISPQGETRNLRRKNRESYTSCTTPAIPLWWLAPPPFPRKRGQSGAAG